MTLFRFGDFEADESAFELRRAGRPVRVQRLVLETLFLLIRGRERVVTKRELSDGPWKGLKVSDAALSRAIMLARRAVEDPAGSIIATVHGKGYRFVAEVRELSAAALSGDGAPSRGRESRPDDGEEAPSTRLLGRTEELAALRRAREQARVGRGRLVVVSGDAGIGKTALLERFAQELEREGVLVAWGRCWRGSAAPRLWPWLEIVRTCGAAAVDAKLDGAPLLGELGASAARLEASAPSDLLLFDAVARFLIELARRRALVLLLEDVQEADHASVALLEFLRQRIGATTLLGVVTRRVEGYGARDLPFDESGRHVQVLALTALSSDIPPALRPELQRRAGERAASLARLTKS